MNKPQIGDRVTAARVAVQGQNGATFRPGHYGVLQAWPPAVRLVPCSVCSKRHQTFASITFQAGGKEERAALQLCNIKKV